MRRQAGSRGGPARTLSQPPEGRKQRPSGLAVPATDYSRAIVLDLALFATVAAGALAVTLGTRPIVSHDIGYHLAYGDHLLSTGRIVQTNRFIYTPLDATVLRDPAELGPGCRFDPDTGTYSFINANWLSQAILSAAHRLGGMIGLSLLHSALVAGMVTVVVLILRRGSGVGAGVPWQWIAPAVILIALTSYERMDLRPESFSAMVLVGQLALLLSPRFGWKHAAAVIALQLLAVNLHSYFLLGIALAGAMLAGAALHWVWARAVTGNVSPELASRVKWFGLAAGGSALAALCNPWFSRGAIFPIQTLLYLAKHRIVGSAPSLDSHPWALIGEMVPALSVQLRNVLATKAFMVVLALTGCAAVAAAALRRWGWLFVMAGIVAVALSARRNMMIGALVLVPVSFLALAQGWNLLTRSLIRSGARPNGEFPSRRLFRIGSGCVAVAAAALAVWSTVSIVTGRFYFSRGRVWRFGLGVSKINVPVGAAEWINRHKPPGNLWCDFADSSNLMYLTDGHRQVPLLTNTFAYPPYLVRENLAVAAGLKPFAPIAERYGVNTVVLRYSLSVPPLISSLARSSEWRIVHLGPKEVVFVRAAGATAELARREGIAEDGLDLPGFVERIASADAVPAYALHSAAVLQTHIGWSRAASACWRRAILLEPEYAEALAGLGMQVLAEARAQLQLAEQFRRQENPVQFDFARNRAREGLQEAHDLLSRLVRLRDDYPDARAGLEWIRGQLFALDRPPAGGNDTDDARR